MSRLVFICFISLAVGGCGQNMTDQPKYDQYQPDDGKKPLQRDAQRLAQFDGAPAHVLKRSIEDNRLTEQTEQEGQRDGNEGC